MKYFVASEGSSTQTVGQSRRFQGEGLYHAMRLEDETGLAVCGRGDLYLWTHSDWVDQKGNRCERCVEAIRRSG